MTVPAFRVHSDVLVTFVAELASFFMARPATLYALVHLSNTPPHNIVTRMHKQFHVVVAHPFCFPDTVAFFSDLKFWLGHRSAP